MRCESTGSSLPLQVNMKTKACAEVGILAEQVDLPETATQEELRVVINRLNTDDTIHGILVQLPLPSHIDSDDIINRIDPRKDADGLTPTSLGRLFQSGMDAPLIPCTPLGCMRLLEHTGIKIAESRCVVIGRSNLVGKPIAQLLMHRNGTVTQCHSRTPEAVLREALSQADIVVVAVGKPQYLKGEWLKPGCTVIDVGINGVPDATKKSGFRLVGDVDYESASKVAGAITPVPGGVGPMTVAMLLRNTIIAYHNIQKVAQ